MDQINYKIYRLIDPITNETRYIGLTFNSLKQRLKSHCYDTGKSHKCNWIRKLKSQGIKPLIEIIEDGITSYENCCQREVYYIEYYKCLQCRLTNSDKGGNKNKIMSKESKLKMSISQYKRYESYKLILSDDTKKQLSKSSTQRFEDDSERQKLRISNKKYEDSKTQNQKLVDILIQNPKPVVKYDKQMNYIEEYVSIRDAFRRTGVFTANIIKCCKGKIKSSGGYIWRYKNDNLI